MRRKRKAIPLAEQLAAALACLLPPPQRDELRRARVPAKAVIRLFMMHHVEFFALGGGCEWHNLHPMTRLAHDARFAADVAAIAKVKRLRVANGMPRQPRGTVQGEFFRPAAVKPRPKRKIAQRAAPWPPRGSRPFRPRVSP